MRNQAVILLLALLGVTTAHAADSDRELARQLALQQKNLGANLQALPMFGVDELFACHHSLCQRGLAADALALPVQVLDDSALSALIARFDQVVTL